MDRGVATIEARIAAAADGWRLDRALADAVEERERWCAVRAAALHLAAELRRGG